MDDHRSWSTIIDKPKQQQEPTRVNTAPDFGNQEAKFGSLGPLDRFLGQIRRRISSETFDLPPMSPVDRYVVFARQRSDQTQAFLMDVIQCDPAMTALVVKKAIRGQSPQPEQSIDLHDAMTRLGTDGLVTVVEQTSNNPFFQQYRDVCRHHLRKMWTNTLFTAFASEKLAEWTGQVPPHTAYLAGLMQNVAEPLLISMLTEVLSADPFAIDNTEDIITLVREHHAELGAEVLSRMGFTTSLCEYVKYHEDRVDTPLAKIVTIAHNKAMDYGYTYPMASRKPALVDQALKALGLDQSVIDSLPEIIGANLNRALSISRRF